MRQDLSELSPIAGLSAGHARPGRRATPLAWLMLSPLVAWVLAFVVAPMVILLVYSFCRRGTLGGVVYEFTLENYAAVLDPTYLGIFVRSIVYAAATTLVCLVLAYPVAYSIGRAASKWRSLLLMLVMIPFWTSFLVRTYAWLTILKSEGLLNSLLLAAGIVSTPLEMLYTPGAVLTGLVYTFLPFMILTIYTSIEKLDWSLVEAASDLGASPARVLSRVVVPMTWPGISAGVLLVFVPALGLYAVNDILGGGKVDMIGNIIENQFRGTARNWPFGAALGMTLVVAFAAALWYTASRQPRET